MKKFSKIAVLAVLAGVPTAGYGISVNTASVKCNPTLSQVQTVECGNIDGLSINVSGGGNVSFGPTICSVSATQTAQQTTQCTAIAGKAGDIANFKAEQLPQTVGTNVFDLGTISRRVDKLGIAAPQLDNGVILNFVTAAGLPISFLIRRQTLTLAELNNLETESQAAIDYKKELTAKFPKDGSPAVLSMYYRQIRGMESTWTELGSDLDAPANYRFAPKFNASVYPNGLVVLRSNLTKDPQSKRLFFVGDHQMQPTNKIVPNPAAGIPIGGEQVATPKDV